MANFHQHFYKEERAFIDRVSNWIVQVEDRNAPCVTHFLNPREFYILGTLVNAHKLQLFSSSMLFSDREFQLHSRGEEFESLDMERKKIEGVEYIKALIAPDYYVLSVDRNEFDIALLQIDYFSKFKKITHSQILGTFLGETGLSRREIGDIIVNSDSAQIYVTKRLLPLFLEQIKEIAGLSVKLTEIPLSTAKTVDIDETKRIILVSSLRLDKILSTTFKISRNFATNMIQSGGVKVNYTITGKKDLQVAVGDLISIKGFGRVSIASVLGRSKKNKLKIEISTILNHKKMR